MKKTTILLLTLLMAALTFTSFKARAQNQTWLNYTNGDEVTGIKGVGNNIWIGTTGGLVKYNKVNGMSTFYNKANSGLPLNEISAVAVELSGTVWVVTNNALTSYNGSNWLTYTTANSGLPTNIVNDVTTDQNGNIWIATAAGLVSYDGVSWVVYDTSNSQISNQFVIAVFTSPTNEKWIITYNGAERFDGSNWVLYDFSVAPYPLYNTTSMAFKNNEVWFATHGDFGQGYGAIMFNGTVWIDYTPANSGIPFNRVECIATDTAGNLWMANYEEFGTGAALVKYDGVNWINNSMGIAGFPDMGLNQLFIDTDNHLFAGSGMQGAVEFTGTSFLKIATSNSGLTQSGGYDIYTDSNSHYWFTNYVGFTHFDGQQWEVFDSTNSSFLNSNVSAIVYDHTGNTWIGTHDGLIKFDGVNWTLYNTSNSGLGDNFINALTVDVDNNIWVGTNTAPFKFDGITWTNYFANAGSHIIDLFVSANGDVWMGSPGYGLSRFDRINTWQNYQPTGGGSFHCGAFDKNGTVWFGANNGLHKWDGSVWTTYGTANGLPWPFISALAVDTNNILWVGTQNGLSKYDGISFTNFGSTNSALTNNYIADIKVDAHNNKWIGTGNGVSVLNENGIILGVISPNETANAGLSFFPNPTHDYLYLISDRSVLQNERLLITDVLGKQVMTVVLKSLHDKIDISALNPGVYFGHLVEEGKQYCSGKIIVQ